MREHCDMYSPQSPNLHVIWCCKLVTWPWVVGNLMGTTDIFLLIWTTFYLLRTFYSLEREERARCPVSGGPQPGPPHDRVTRGHVLVWNSPRIQDVDTTMRRTWHFDTCHTHIWTHLLYCHIMTTAITALVTRISKKLCSVTSHLTWLVVCSITSRCAGCHAVMLHDTSQ